MDTNKMREQFENSPKFRGMDFTRAPEAPDYYLSPYANGAWDGWKASREAVVVELPKPDDSFENHDYLIDRELTVKAIEAQGLKVEVKP